MLFGKIKNMETKMKNYNRIIFAGETGNNRSAMATYIMKEYRLNKPIDIICRGYVVLFPEPINQKAEAVLISNGIKVENFTSVQLENFELKDEVLVIVMEEVEREKILATYESATAENVQVLTELTGDKLEIINPYGLALQAYGLCYESLNNSIKKLVEIINGDRE